MWRDETRLSAGDMIHDEIKKGLASSSHVVALITPAYLKRAPPLIELGMASYGNHAGRIIPILHGTRHRDVERQLFVLAGRYMKTWNGDPEQIADEIAEIVEVSTGEPAKTHAWGPRRRTRRGCDSYGKYRGGSQHPSGDQRHQDGPERASRRD